ncbi:MAG: DUF2490 domain-containing protein [Chitinophagaceae bacterium]|nr:DUF2490 domain-containing protein [Chitinophagaceae bacterium]
MRSILIICFSLLSSRLAAQSKPVIYEQQTWLGYYPQYKFSRHWGLWFDSEIHTGDHFFNGFSQGTLRLAATYYNNKKNKFTAGYGITDFFPGDNHKYISISERFLWQQYQWFGYTPNTKLMQWLRMEEKWKTDVQDDYTAANTSSFLYRWRYNIFYTIALSKKGMVPNAVSLALGNELYLYYGPRLSNHVFDQDRVFAGFSYAVNSHDNLVFGMMNMLQSDLSGTQYKDNLVLRFSFFENIGTHRTAE